MEKVTSELILSEMGRPSELQVQSYGRVCSSLWLVVGSSGTSWLCVVVGEVWRKKGLEGTTYAVIDSYRRSGVN